MAKKREVVSAFAFAKVNDRGKLGAKAMLDMPFEEVAGNCFRSPIKLTKPDPPWRFSITPAVNGSATYERITPIYMSGGRVISSATNHKTSIVDLVIAYCIRLEDFDTAAVCRAAKGVGRIVERKAVVPINTAFKASCPAKFSVIYRCRSAHLPQLRYA